jgi:hypothetical protein
MRGRFDDDATASGHRAASRSTASTAPGISGSRSRYRASIRRTTSALISSGGSGIPSAECMYADHSGELMPIIARCASGPY